MDISVLLGAETLYTPELSVDVESITVSSDVLIASTTIPRQGFLIMLE
jgi:hypothetical protein